MQRWSATILTQANDIQNVEIVTQNSIRRDAIAQVKSMYGAKEVRQCVPVSVSYDDSSTGSSRSSGGGSDTSIDGIFLLILILFGLGLLWAFRWVILAVGIIAGLYFLYALIVTKK